MSYLSCVYSTQFEGCEKQVGNRKVGISESNCSPLTEGPVIQGSEKNNKEVNSSGYGTSFHLYTSIIWF